MTRRVKVYTGFKCNARCKFCYYWDSLDAESPPTEEIKAKLRYAKNHGIKDVDFSGGESTIRTDFPELVSYAKDLGFRYICVITNGIKLAREEYFKELVKCGLNDTLFSIQGHNAEVHDYLTQVPGSFDKISKAIQYAKKFELKVRTNTTVTSVNYKYLSELANYLVDIRPNAVNFILFNDWCSASKVIREMSCRYSKASPYLKKAINILDPLIKKVTVRYIPFCFMVGYEKYVCNLLQKKYDPDEWNDYIKARLLGNVKDKGLDWVRFIYYLARNFKNHPSIIKKFRFNLYEMAHDIAIEQMRKGYSKNHTCRKCNYIHICDGLENSYAREFGFDELKPILGKQTYDPLFYRRGRKA